MSELCPIRSRASLWARFSLFSLLGVLWSPSVGCEHRTGPDASATEMQEPESAPGDQPTEPVIDADWVASKLQAPPPPDRKDWLREIEKDPIAALKQMDPSALQSNRGRPVDPAEITPIRSKNPAKYDATKPLRDWPPVTGQFYPNLVLKDQTGQVTALSDFRGKVVLVEVVGLTCRACHAFAGGNESGRERFRGIEPQRGVDSIEKYAQGYAKVSLDHPDIVFVQLVLYGMDGLSPPSLDDVRAWSRHFGMDRYRNEVVLVGDERFISPQTRRLIPGFHLIDRNGILRAMHSNDPRHDNLYTALLPSLGELANTRW